MTRAASPIAHEDPLFDWEPRLARLTDPDTSHEAGGVVRPHLSYLQTFVLAVFVRRGPMTARCAERLPEFAAYGFSTIRKRISELAQLGRLQETGLDESGRAPCTIYEVTGGT